MPSIHLSSQVVIFDQSFENQRKRKKDTTVLRDIEIL